jgi:predicted DNA-binding transcriptional regulator AlpA
MNNDFIPLKRVAAELGVSRATFWRVSRSVDFPRPTRIRGRVFWRKHDLPAMETALDAFQGRSAFERIRRQDKAREAATKAMAAIRKPKRRQTRESAPQQLDLFSIAE